MPAETLFSTITCSVATTSVDCSSGTLELSLYKPEALACVIIPAKAIAKVKGGVASLIIGGLKYCLPDHRLRVESTSRCLWPTAQHKEVSGTVGLNIAQLSVGRVIEGLDGKSPNHGG